MTNQNTHAPVNPIEQFKLFQDALDEAKNKVGQINILVTGKTGVGKSSLVNAVFGREIAQVGQGRPVSQEIETHSIPGVPVTITDTKGLELAGYARILADLKNHILEMKRDPDPNNDIHLAWLCIMEDSRRVEQAEIDMVKMLREMGIPVIAVITKKRSDDGFKAKVQELLPGISGIVRVRALPERIEFDDGPKTLKPEGLDDLVKLSHKLIPEALEMAFISAQKIDLAAKVALARRAARTAAAAAAAACATPVPMSDAVALSTIQVGMIASISYIFGLSIDRKVVVGILAAIIGPTAATMAGRSLVSWVLKATGVGYAAGTALSASVAAPITLGLGYGYASALAKFIENNPGKQPQPVDIPNMLKTALSSQDKQAIEEEAKQLPASDEAIAAAKK